MSLARTEYYRSELLSVSYVACRCAERDLSDVENADADILIFPLRGAFMEHFSRGAHVLAEPNLALIFPAGSSSRISHPVSDNDDCLVMDFSEACFQEVRDSVLVSRGILSCGTHSLLTPDRMAARNLIWHRLAHRLAEPLEVEETALALLSYVLRCSREARMPRRRDSRIPKQIEAAKVVLLSHPERKWSLTSLARALECSPYHLTRMFCEYVGVPLHRYQLHTRLARAIDLILETDRDLMTIALDLGFSGHSHFTASFRQATGFTPSRLREAASSRIVAQLRKVLRAYRR